MRFGIASILVLALASGGCLSGRRGHGNGDDDDDDDSRPVGGDDDEDGNNSGPGDEELCAGYDPLPDAVTATLTGTYSPDGIDSVEVMGIVELTLTPGEYNHVISGFFDLRDTAERPLATCEDGTGSAECYGGLSATFCGGDGTFSYDLSMGSGSWSHDDAETSAYGSGEAFLLE